MSVMAAEEETCRRLGHRFRMGLGNREVCWICGKEGRKWYTEQDVQMAEQAAAARAREDEREAWEQVAGMVDRLAFDMRAPNIYTPQFVQLMIEARQAAAIRARSEGGGE